MREIRVIPLRAPSVARNCPRCGPTKYSQSGKFRVNAQKRTLDVWLVYRCDQCENTWNMEILARVKPEAIPAELFRGYTDNDEHLALLCALDRGLLIKNAARAEEDTLEYELSGEPPLPEESCELKFICEADMGLRVDALLARALCLSRSEVRRRFDAELFSCPGGARARMGRELTVWVKSAAP